VPVDRYSERAVLRLARGDHGGLSAQRQRREIVRRVVGTTVERVDIDSIIRVRARGGAIAQENRLLCRGVDDFRARCEQAPIVAEHGEHAALVAKVQRRLPSRRVEVPAPHLHCVGGRGRGGRAGFYSHSTSCRPSGRSKATQADVPGRIYSYPCSSCRFIIE